MGPLKQWGKIAAIPRYCLIVLYMNGFKKISLDDIDLFCKLRYFSGTFKMIWTVAPNPGFWP